MRRKLTAFGALAGLAWAASLRGYMSELSGTASVVDWVGTFLFVLAPGLAVGALLGFAEAIRRRGGRRGWRLLALAPLLLGVVPLLPPGALQALIATGIGGGALALSLAGMAGGFAISGRGPLWARIASGVPALAALGASAVAGSFIRPHELALTEPRGVWVAVLSLTLTALLMLACSIPHARVVVSHPWG